MDRRTMLAGSAAMATIAPFAPAAGAAGKPPWRILYNNDTTNLLSCASPWRPEGARFSDALIAASVREVAGKVDAHLLSPGLGWVAWWQSKIVPPAEHYRWFTAATGLPIDAIGRYLLDGGDLVARFVTECRATGQAPLISYRLNDTQPLHDIDRKTRSLATAGRFYVDHPEYRLPADAHGRPQLGQNWAIAAVRAWKFALIEELCLEYDIDGLELDFERFPVFFDPATTAPAQRRAIMAGFVAGVRGALDRGAARHGGRARRLGIRIPCYVDTHDAIGVDPAAMAAAGVDFITISNFLLTTSQTDLPRIRHAAPAVAIYQELTGATNVDHARGVASDIRTTDIIFRTAADIAYAQGADGVSLFNFAYYRAHAGGTGPFDEPPFAVIPTLRAPRSAAGLPRCIVLAADFNQPARAVPLMPQGFDRGRTRRLTFTMPADPANSGRLRLRAREAGRRQWLVTLNGRTLVADASLAPLVVDPYRANAAIDPARFTAFVLPPGIVRDGDNRLVVTLAAGPPAVIDYLDVAIA